MRLDAWCEGRLALHAEIEWGDESSAQTSRLSMHPYSAHDRKPRILERSDCFQGRIANREQVQVQIDFPQHQDWVRQFRDWWKDGINMWRHRNDENATLIFLCELGPPPYAMTDANQAELSDRWQEALTIRSWVEEIWSSPD